MARYNASVDFRCSGNQYGYMELMFIDLNNLRHSPIYLGKMSQKPLFSLLSFMFIFSLSDQEYDAYGTFNNIRHAFFRNS